MENINQKTKIANDITVILEKSGYYSDFSLNHRFRYSIIEEPDVTIILGAKIPIYFPLRLQIPAELVCFFPSLIFKLRDNRLDDKVSENIEFVANSFKQVIGELKPYKHEFNFTGYRPKIKSLIEDYMPNEDVIERESDLSEINLKSNIRKKYILEKDKTHFDEINEKLSQDVLDIYRDYHLRPTVKMPPEISEGFPEGRENLTVIFKSEEPNQYMVVEPGSLSYWRDIHHNNVWIRTGTESHWLHVIYKTFSDKDYRLNYLIYDWIMYCRGLIQPLMKMLNSQEFEYQVLQPFSEIKLINDSLNKKEYPGIFVPHLSYECITSEVIKPRNEILFNSAPTSLSEVNSINYYLDAEYLIQRNDLSRAKVLLELSLKKLKSAHHIQGQLKVLLKIVEIAEKQNKFSEAAQLLNACFSLAKKTELTAEEISHIHNQFIRIFALKGDLNSSERHFVINLKFLESLDKTDEVEQLILDSHIEMFKVRFHQKNLKLAKEHLKSIIKFIKKYPKYEFLYYFLRSKYEGLSDNPKKKFSFLEKADEIEEGPIFEHILTKFELGKHYLYQEGKAKNSLSYLKGADDLIKSIDVQKLRLKIKIHEIMKDAYTSLNDTQKTEEIEQQITNLREKLDRFN